MNSLRFVTKRQLHHRITNLCRRQSTFSGEKSAIFDISAEVEAALNENRGVVALESTVITHGLQHPTNFEVATNLEEIVRDRGCVPATIALMNGKIKVGLASAELEEVANSTKTAVKASIRDISNVLTEKQVGGTTVASTMWVAHQMGIKVFSTGGIGGVHRGAEQTMDISADLTVLGRIPVAVVCAGTKSILDIRKTLEVLETNGVNIVVYDEQNFYPGFYSPRTKHKAPYNTTSMEKIVKILEFTDQLNLQRGTLIACPLPDEYTERAKNLDRLIEMALEELEHSGLQLGKDATPFLLKRLNQHSSSESTKINIALLYNNAKIAGKLADAYAKSRREILRDTPRNVSTIKASSADDATPLSAPSRTPNVLCIGASVFDIEVVTRGNSEKESGGNVPSKIFQRAGGVARNHADGLTRLGCNVNFITALGRDHFASVLRGTNAHMNWSHAIISERHGTASSVSINDDGKIRQGFIDVDDIIAEISPSMILRQKELIKSADGILLDANLSTDTINQVCSIAVEYNKEIWFEPTNALKIHKACREWPYITVFTPNIKEFEYLTTYIGRHLSTQPFDCPSKLADHLRSNKQLIELLFERNLKLLVISIDKAGSLAIAKRENDVEFIEVPPPIIDQNEIVSVSGAGDCFNCGLLYGRLHGLDTMEGLKLGNACAAESLKSIEAVPHTFNRVLKKL